MMAKSVPAAHSKEIVFVFDASAFVFRAYYALAPLSSKGRPSHALAGFASTLLKIIKEHRPHACVIVFDSKKPTFRKDIYPEYKANREVPPPDLSDQIQAVMELCRAAGLPILQDEGFEADDWIASFVKKFKKDYQIAILSSDKDLAQLVDKQVRLYDSFKDRWMGPDDVKEKWGVPPEKMLDLLALTGDTSDNIPGIEGVGPKTAAKLLEEYGSISGILKDRSKLSPKLKEKFASADKDLDLSTRLVRLKDDLKVPENVVVETKIPFPPSFYNFLVEWDLGRVLKQFPEFALDGESAAPVVAGDRSSSGQFYLINSQEELQKIRQRLKQEKLIVIDTETSSFDRAKAQLVGVSFCFSDSEAFYLPVRHQGMEIKEADARQFLKELLAHQALFVAQNGKYDLQIFEKEGFEVSQVFHDTMIEAYLLHADRRSFSLENLARDFLHEEKGDLKGLLGKGEDFSEVPLELATEYAAKDSLLTYKLHQQFEPQIEKDKRLSWLWHNVELPLIRVLADMETVGVRLDVAHLKKLSVEMHKRLERTEKEIFKSAGREFNIASPKQLQQVLFEELKLPTLKKTKTGYSTDESVLEELSFHHEVPRLIIEQRKLAKLTSTYIDVLPELVAADGRLHTHYHQTGTQTGRLSSSEPNLQNIPVRSEEGMEIRKAFIPEKGFQLMSADYSQVELRLMAHFSGDEKMIEAFQNGRDIHAETAKIIFGSSDKEFRSRAKAINFGIIYGISAFGLSQQLGIDRSEAKKFIDSYFEQFPRIKAYMDEAQTTARKLVYTETLFGRRRPLPDILSKNPTLKAMAERMAINSPLQGTAADIMKWGMVRVHARLQSESCKSRILLQVHDELVLEVAVGEEEKVRQILVEGMTNLKSTPAEALSVPLVVDTSVGQNWAEL